MYRFALLVAALAATPARSAPLDIVTDIPVTQALVSAVTGQEDAPSLLLDAGTDPHHATLRPSQARMLARADLVIAIGAGMTPWLDRAAESIGGGELMTLAEAEGTHRIALDAPEPGAGEQEPHAAHGDHEHGDRADPHLWLDPGNAVTWLAAIAEELADRDPENAARYRDRAGAAIAEVKTAAADASERIAALPARPILVAHDAWDYAAEAFGIEIAGHVADSEAAAPGAAHLSELHARIAERRPACILAAPTDAMAQPRRLSEEAGLDIVTVDPLGTGEDGIAAYVAILDGIAAGMESCLAH